MDSQYVYQFRDAKPARSLGSKSRFPKGKVDTGKENERLQGCQTAA